MPVLVNVRATRVVNAPPEAVWDFTQDYALRPTWDRSVIAATVIGLHPRTIDIRGRGGFRCTLVYKADRRPSRTSLTMTRVRSAVIESGGGSWRYDPCPQGTRWTQINTLRLRLPRWTGPITRPIVGLMFRAQVRAAMRAASAAIEARA